MFINMKQRITIIIPCFNTEKYVRPAIESVLAQGYENLELILVDDGSTDASATVIQSFGTAVQYFYQPNGGASAARNTGLKYVTGDWIGFLDADDLMLEGTISAYLEAMQTYPETRLFWSRLKMQYEIGAIKVNHRLADDITMHSTSVGTILCKSNVFTQIGLFDETLRLAEDIDWFKRAIDHAIPIHKIDKVTMICRRHDSNTTTHMRFSQMKQLFQVFKNTIDRQRLNNRLKME